MANGQLICQECAVQEVTKHKGKDLIKILLPTDGVGHEGVWAFKRPDNTAEINNIPGCTTEYALGDIVRYDPGTMVVTELVQRVGYTSIVRYPTGPDAATTHKHFGLLVGFLRARGVKTEGMAAGYLSITTPAAWSQHSIRHLVHEEAARDMKVKFELAASNAPSDTPDGPALKDLYALLHGPARAPVDTDTSAGSSNLERANRSYGVLMHYTNVHSTVNEPARDVLGDLLGDLLHLCRLTGLDFEDSLRRARQHAAAEEKGEV